MSGVRRKITEISVFEFFICMSVITIHLLSEGVDGFAKWSAASIIFSSLTRLISFAVPGFVFTSAIKLFYKYSESKFRYGRFLLGRFLKVYLPYVIAVVVYYLVFIYVLKLDAYGSFNLKQLGHYILWGDISAQFYFVILIVQFYILMPVWILISKLKSNIFAALLIAVSIVVTIISRMSFPALAANALTSLGNIQTPFLNPLSGFTADADTIKNLSGFTNKFFTSYLVFWISGMYIGLNYEKFTELIHAGRPVIYIGWFLLAVAHCILSYLKLCGISRYSFEPIIVVFFCIFSIFGFYIYVNNLTISLERMGKGFLTSIADASYDIYLIHCLVITVVYFYLKQVDIENILTRFWITAAITYSFSIIFCVLQSTIQTNLRLKYRRWSAAQARKSARRKRYL